MTQPKPPAKRPTVVDLTDLTYDELDEVTRLMADDKLNVGRLTAFAFVGIRRTRPDLTLDEARAFTGRDVKIIETDPEVDDDRPTSSR